jgi:hypothetical protein
MRNHTVRLYAVAAALAVFFVSWAVIAARPWATEAAVSTTNDPRLVQLVKREHQLRKEAARARKIVEKRWAAYRVALAKRKKENASIRDANTQLAAAAAQPRIVTIPASSSTPVTSTRTS